MRRARPFVCSATILVAAFASAGPARAGAAVVDRVVAVVGHAPVLLSELRAREAPLRAQLAGLSDAERATKQAALDKQVLDGMVAELLETGIAAAKHVEVSDDEVNTAISQIAQRNGLSVAGVMAAARQQGMADADYRAEIARQILDAKLVQLVVAPTVRHDPTMSTDDWTQALSQARSAWLSELRNAAYVDVRL
jgi:parvulin-like peptidyl-prolyl isomerase